MTRIASLAALLPLLLTSIAGAAPFYSEGPDVPPLVAEAIAICQTAGERSESERRRLTTRGIALAERAVAERNEDPRAHFALFCNLGRHAELEGVSMDALATVRRVEAALDRALDLEPEYLDALVGKALLLIELPWMLGGDEDRGEELLRHAVALDRSFEPAREHLARHLEAEGRLDEMPGPVLALRVVSPDA